MPKAVDYYFYSRCKYWSVRDLLRLIFNDKNFSIPPQKVSPQAKYLQLIKKAIKSGGLRTFDLPRTPQNQRLIFCNEVLRARFKIYNKWLKASDT